MSTLQDKLAELRRIKAQSDAIQAKIQSYNPVQSHIAPNRIQQQPQADAYMRYMQHRQEPDMVGDMIMRDFEEINHDRIEKRLKMQRAKILLNNIMAEANNNYTARYNDEMYNSIHTIQDAEHALKATQSKPKPVHNEQIKQVIIKDNPADMDMRTIDEADRIRINAYIDECYALILKVIKVYLIRSAIKEYTLPAKHEIEQIKTAVEGFTLVPRSKYFTLYKGCRIFYMDITDTSNRGDFKVELKEAWVIKHTYKYIIITTNEDYCFAKRRNTVAGPGFWKNNDYRKCMKKIDYRYPIFRKITDTDIQDNCMTTDLDSEYEVLTDSSEDEDS